MRRVERSGGGASSKVERDKALRVSAFDGLEDARHGVRVHAGNAVFDSGDRGLVGTDQRGEVGLRQSAPLPKSLEVRTKHVPSYATSSYGDLP